MRTFAVESLKRNGQVILALYDSLRAEQLLWRPSPEKWSLVEILHHLYDEEREDFRLRLQSVLKDPLQPFQPIDPGGWVRSRNYQARPVAELLSGFSEERAASVQWLSSLDVPDWEVANIHPKFGPMSAGTLLSSWVAHDLLHIRQITATKFQYATEMCAPYENQYAGDW